MRIKGKTKIKKPKTIKNRSALKIAIIAGVVLFGLILPQLASATIFESVGKEILIIFTNAIHYLLNWLVLAGAAVFEGALEIGFESNLDIVKTGWQLTRDFANMFFILFMVVIAFTTILRLPRYGIKDLLPKVIGVALLINFSLVMSSVIIDFSNITANFFIDDIKTKLKGTYGDKSGLISASFADSFDLTQKDITFTDCNQYKSVAKQACDKYFSGLDKLLGERKRCYKKVEENTQKCERDKQITVPGPEANFLNIFLSMTVGSIVMLVAAFVFFAGGILLLIRVIVLWFLVMVVPLAFICYIMPGLKNNWQKWWKSFLNWCFFAPAFGFFIWMAITLSTNSAIKRLAASINVPVGNFDPASSVFVSIPGEQLISYLFTAAFLLGGLIMAKQFGIYGADTVMKLGQQAYRGIGRWTAARTRERAAKPMEKLAGGMAKLYGKTLGRIPGIKELGLGRIAQAPAQVMRAQQKAVAEEEKKLSTYSIATLKSLYPTFNRTQQIAAAQIMAEKGTLASEKDRFGREIGNFRERHIQKIIKVSNLYGEAMVKPLLINRLDLAPLVKKPWQNDQQAIEERLIKITPEKAGNIQYEAIKNPLFGDFIMEKMIQHFRPTHFAKIANVNVRVMNEITDQKFANPVYGATPINRKTHFEGINKPLADYIDGLMGQSVGWHF